MKTMLRVVDSAHEADLLPMDQLLYEYVDEIFSDYRAQRASLVEVVDEIKAIIGELIPAKEMESSRRRDHQKSGETSCPQRKNIDNLRMNASVRPMMLNRQKQQLVSSRWLRDGEWPL